MNNASQQIMPTTYPVHAFDSSPPAIMVVVQPAKMIVAPHWADFFFSWAWTKPGRHNAMASRTLIIMFSP